MPLSYQLYSSRNFGPLPATLQMLADAGYRHVEGYGGLFADLDALEAGLAETGLKMTTAHIGLTEIGADPAGTIALAERLGLEAVYAPYLPAEMRPDDLAGWRGFAAQLAAALKPLTDAGLVTGWHNHDFELADLGGGTTPLDVLAEAGLGFELDLGWLVRAGHDPANWIAKLGRAISAVHVKDIAPKGTEAEDGWADLGHGVVDYGPIIAAARAAGIARYIAEHDNPGDDARFAARSIATFQTL